MVSDWCINFQSLGCIKLQPLLTTLVEASGLTWQEAVTALGMASKTLAMQAYDDGNEPEHACLEQATKYLTKGLKHDAAPQFYTLH
jgi:hypothetical protein